MATDFYSFWQMYNTGTFAEMWHKINPLLIGILVMIFTAKMSPFYFGNIIVNFHPHFTLLERIIPYDY